MVLNSKTKIAIAGAGTIGCYVGGCLADAGCDVTFLVRERLAVPLRSNGLELGDLEGNPRRLAPDALHVETNAKKALSGADLVLVTVKSHATAEMAKLIRQHVPEAIVVSLQNGVGNANIIASALGQSASVGQGASVISGMVPFNVVQAREEGKLPRFQRTTSGTVLVGAGVSGLAELLNVPGLPTKAADDMPGVLWSKLVLNMNNALNALSGLPLVEELADPAWRRLLADQMEEALWAISAADISLARIEGVHPRLIPIALRLPTPLFRLVARKMLAIAPDARSSMWEDFQMGRKTEINDLQGAVIALAKEHGQTAPVCERVVHLVKDQEKKKQFSAMTPGEIAKGIG